MVPLSALWDLIHTAKMSPQAVGEMSQMKFIFSLSFVLIACLAFIKFFVLCRSHIKANVSQDLFVKCKKKLESHSGVCVQGASS